jgi:hypothetical protein
MTYRTVFDVTQVGMQPGIPLLMLIFAGLFVVIGWGIKTSGDRNSFLKGTIFQLGGVLGILGALGFSVSLYSEYHRAEKALAGHDYLVTEGMVEHFIPMPPGGHSTESFVVNEVHFEIR